MDNDQKDDWIDLTPYFLHWFLLQKLQENNIRLSRYFGSIREDDAEIIDRLQEQESDAVTRAIEIINNRVNQYGVSEPNIQPQGARRIIVELPGVKDRDRVRELLQGTANLEFWETFENWLYL